MKLPRRSFWALAVALAACLLLLASQRGGLVRTSTAEEAGVVVAIDHESPGPCRLLIESGPETVVDRGSQDLDAPRCAFVGSFRYWEEPSGRMLYLYDDVQNLVGRVVNPERVLLLGPAVN
jgi:hypothetical protein